MFETNDFLSLSRDQTLPAGRQITQRNDFCNAWWCFLVQFVLLNVILFFPSVGAGYNFTVHYYDSHAGGVLLPLPHWVISILMNFHTVLILKLNTCLALLWPSFSLCLMVHDFMLSSSLFVLRSAKNSIYSSSSFIENTSWYFEIKERIFSLEWIKFSLW